MSFRPRDAGQTVLTDAMPARTKPASASDLVSDIPQIFDQAQVTTANHQKNYVALHKLQSEAALQVEQDKKQVRLTGERAFEDVFLQMVARFLPVKKGPSQVDRVVKFVGGYIKFVNEKGTLIV
jgi:condensin complex subunit 3